MTGLLVLFGCKLGKIGYGQAMVFKRRKPLSWIQQARQAVYPTTGWRRAVHYIGYRLKRLPDTPHRISLGIAAGVFVSFSPLFGLHFIYAGLVAMLVRANILASLLGTFLGNPLTFPVIAAVSYRSGKELMGMPYDPHTMITLKDNMMHGLSGLWHSCLSVFGLSQSRWSDVADFYYNLFLPYYVGGIIPGLLAGAVAYFVMRPLVAAYQKRRRGLLAKIAPKAPSSPKTKSFDPAE